MSSLANALASKVIVVDAPACAVPVRPSWKTLLEPVSVMLPFTELGVSVPAGLVVVIVKAYKGMLSKVIVLAVQLASVAPRTIRVGAKSGCTTISVSALCVQLI